MGVVSDLTGKRYERLVVIDRAPDRYTKSGRKLIVWNCRCDCGKIISVDANNLRTGNTTSCGCKTNAVDMTGKRFGKLLVVSRAENNKRADAMWNCVCDCGKTVVIKGSSIRRGATNSCGCGIVDGLKIGWELSTHGMTHTRLYSIWCGIKSRTCENADGKHKKDYYDRGIRMCEEWENSFEAFYEWSMQNGYKDNLTIDRENNDGDYCPENCRWVDRITQCNNKRNNRYYTYDGKTQTIAQWAREYNHPYDMLRERLVVLGWNIEKALNTPSKKGVVL